MRSSSKFGDYVTLTKPRLNFLVLLTTAAAYSLGAPPEATLIDLVHTLAGTFLVAGGAAALNQVWERATDRLMRRTAQRPMADQRLSVAQGTAFGFLLTAIGAAELAWFVNPLSSAIALLTTATYVLFYTPLKLRTSLSTLAGAIPGALPAVIGWAAATNTLSIEAWVLFGIVFMWQMPHFLALAWVYRDEYARAGMPLLPVIEPDGRSTGRQAVLYTAVLIPFSLLPTGVGLATAFYLVGAIALGAVLMLLSLEFSAKRSLDTARRLFFGSILYLPILWALLVFDHRRLGVTNLPALNATLNGMSFLFLVVGYVFIRRGQWQRHRACMIGALVMSALFLTSYVIYHLNVGSVPFKRTGWIRTVYFAVLIPHVVLAAGIVPLVLMTVSRALRKRYDRHRVIARWTLPLWMFVSITGVIVYVMLYQM